MEVAESSIEVAEASIEPSFMEAPTEASVEDSFAFIEASMEAIFKKEAVFVEAFTEQGYRWPLTCQP